MNPTKINYSYVHSKGKVSLMHSDLTVNASMRWDIENFRECQQPRRIGERIMSPKFHSVPNVDIEWEISLYPKGETFNTRDFMGIYLQPTTKTPVDVYVVFSLLNDRNEEFNRYGMEIKSASSNISWGCKKFIRRSIIFQRELRLLNRGKLSILCTVKTNVDNDARAVADVKMGIINNNNNEHHLFEDLLNNERFSDVTFILTTSNKKIHGHKNILAYSSTIFNEMFESNDCSAVEIHNMEYEIFHELLRFIYCGKIDQFNRYAKELLAGAKAYGLQEVEVRCENFLCNNLSIDNAIEYLHVADDCESERLKAKAIGYIIANGKDIALKPEFKTIAELHTDLIIEVFSALVSHGV